MRRPMERAAKAIEAVPGEALLALYRSVRILLCFRNARDAMTFVRFPDEISDIGQSGGKAGALAKLQQAIHHVPGWFVIDPAAFEASLNDEQRRIVAAGDFDFDALRLRLLPESLRHEISNGLKRICPDSAPVAVRSSAVEEDSAEASFAGQLESFLNVAPEDVCDRVVDVWRSGFSSRVREYRRRKGISGELRPPAVLVQRMVSAEVSGVAFSSDPVRGDRDHCVVAAVSGLGDKLVLGEVEGATYRVARNGTVTPSPGAAAPPGLSDDRLRAVAELARRAEGLFGVPQDIEWAIANGTLYLLQSRPITMVPAKSTGAAILWDNSNIVESYSGVTSPLTFSFARYVYEAVYRQFVAVLGVPHAQIERNAVVFQNMLGFVHGRVYYNLLNWYRLIAMLPGFAVNRRFLEQMLGVSRTIPHDFIERIAPAEASLVDRVASFPRTAHTVFRIIVNWFLLRRKIARFYDRLDEALAKPAAALRAMSLAELGAAYRELEADLLTKWDAPILNDFFTMIFFGLSKEVLKRWCGQQGEAMHNSFLKEQGGIISTEPVRLIREMAAVARDDDVLTASLVSGPPESWAAAIGNNPQFKACFDRYIERFGDRCLQELKLESPTLHDDPATLVRTIGYMAKQSPQAATPLREERPFSVLASLLRGKRLRHAVARWLVLQAKQRVRDRENLRFERTRVFGRVRQIFIEMGKRLAEAGRLEDPASIFFLEVPELLGTIEGTATTCDLKALAAIRRADAARFRAMPDPPNRFETQGAVSWSVLHSSSPPDDGASGDADARSGLGCSPGLVRGAVRVVSEPSGQTVGPGEILVARHTDPGWVLLFGNAAGVLVERGSLLSHSAIVAREMGIPAIVSIPGLLDWLADGDLVEMDGSRGVVRRLTGVAQGENNDGSAGNRR